MLDLETLLCTRTAYKYYPPTKTWDPRNSNTVGVIDLFHRKSASSMTPNEARTIKHNMLHKLIVHALKTNLNNLKTKLPPYGK